MSPRDVTAPRASSQQSWFAVTSLSDPDAALLASTRPPEAASLPDVIRSRIAAWSFGAWSLGALAERLHRRLPSQFPSRDGARRWILGATVGVGVGMGLLLSYGVTGRASNAQSAAPSESRVAARTGETVTAAAMGVAASETRLAELGATPTPAPLATAAPEVQVVAALEPTPPVSRQVKRASKAKGASTWKKKKKPAARRRTATSRRLTSN